MRSVDQLFCVTLWLQRVSKLRHLKAMTAWHHHYWRCRLTQSNDMYDWVSGPHAPQF